MPKGGHSNMIANENAPALTHLLCVMYRVYDSPFTWLTSSGDVMWCNEVIPCCHMTSWYHTMGQDFIWGYSNQKTLLWPLIYDLDHRTRPRFHQCQSLYQFWCPYIKRFGRESADYTQTDRHTNGTDSITSTADAGGNDHVQYFKLPHFGVICYRVTGITKPHIPSRTMIHYRVQRIWQTDFKDVLMGNSHIWQ